MSNNTSAAKREELLKKKEHWFAQRLAAQEREKLAAENDLALLSLNETPGTNSDLTRNANPNKSDCVHESNSQSLVSRNAPYPGDEQVLDRITERITNRLREEVRSEVTYLSTRPKKKSVQLIFRTDTCCRSCGMWKKNHAKEARNFKN